MLRNGLCWFCSAVALLLTLACASPTTVSADPMQVELDAFSGRPNHQWVASPERASSLSRALSSLPAAPARPEPDHLGYRGFIIRQGGLQARVYGGYVIVTEKDATRTLVDSAGLEAQLIADATERGFGDIVRK